MNKMVTLPPQSGTEVQLLAACRAGRGIVLVESSGSEAVGHLVIAAEHAGADAVNFAATHARGLVCLALEGAIADRLGLALLAQSNRARPGPAFTVSIEACEGISTGISTSDRAMTIAAAIRTGAGPADLASPGHVFPVRVDGSGPEDAAAAAVALCRAAGMRPAALICAILGADGRMANLQQLGKFAAAHGLPLAQVAAVAPALGTSLVQGHLSGR